MPSPTLSRRTCLAAVVASSFAIQHGVHAGEADSKFRLATFTADVTVPLDHGMMGGSWRSKSVADPLEAHGVVLLGSEAPIVFVSVDWCEIRNDAYAQWQEQLAKACGTLPERVLVSAVHQHDAPVADLTAEAILRAARRPGSVCDPEFHAKVVARVVKAAHEAIENARPITHLGMGQAKVERIASNRRYLTPDKAVHYNRMSKSRITEAIAADEGTIDPWLKTLTFY